MDYLHLYHPQCGLEVMLKDGRKGIFHGVTNSMMCKIFIDGGYVDEYANNIKPILRHLSDMNDEERRECYVIGTWRYKNGKDEMIFTQIDSRQFVYLLSNHFDLFELIEAGLAIDKTKVKSESI